VTPVGNVCPECASEVTEVPDARVDPQWGLRFRRRYYQAADDDLGGGVVETLFDVFDLFALGESATDGFDDDSDVDFFDS
jgi:hypothetical protein